MYFDFAAKMVGAVAVWLILTYYRIRHPFTWRERFVEKHRKTEVVYTGEETPKGTRRIGGDYTISDVIGLIDALHSFAFGNFIILNSKGEYISIKSTKSGVQQ